MKKFLFAGILSFCFYLGFAQTVANKLQNAYSIFEKDEQLKHATSSLYIIDAKTGTVVFDKNSQVGLAPASTQKIITAATAFELLGKDYKYKTEIYTKGKELHIIPSGDPTFGSNRWSFTNSDTILSKMTRVVNPSLINKIFIDDIKYDVKNIPDGWIWQDIGNYYGAPARDFNWMENQFDLLLKSSSKIGDTVSVVATVPKLYNYQLISHAVAAPEGTGDNSYIYLSSTDIFGFVTGTIPVNQKRFKISGTIPDPKEEFVATLNNIYKNEKKINIISENIKFYSPSLDSIIYWFLKKSINLYGEALVKTFAYEKQGYGSTDSGVNIVREFWKAKGLDIDELNMYDGSGLSPLNRVTTHAQVEILKYAKTKDWFPYYLNAFPDYNGMKMKSGTISDVKGFCGYHTAKDGNEYIFSFLVNNYTGSSSSLVSKMYKVLDGLK